MMEELGQEAESIVMLLIGEMIRRDETIQQHELDLDDLRRRLFGQTRERDVNPDQLEIFPNQIQHIPLPPPDSEQDTEPTRSRKRKHRVLFHNEFTKHLPTETVEIDPKGDRSRS